jgi:hypothetical protein
MITAKLRITIAAIAAASSIAVVATGPVTPAALAAKNIPGSFQKSSEGTKQMQPSCQGMQSTFNSYSDLAEAEFNAGNYAAAQQDDDTAAAALSNAAHAGCLWAL